MGFQHWGKVEIMNEASKFSMIMILGTSSSNQRNQSILQASIKNVIINLTRKFFFSWTYYCKIYLHNQLFFFFRCLNILSTCFVWSEFNDFVIIFKKCIFPFFMGNKIIHLCSFSIYIYLFFLSTNCFRFYCLRLTELIVNHEIPSLLHQAKVGLSSFSLQKKNFITWEQKYTF